MQKSILAFPVIFGLLASSYANSTYIPTLDNSETKTYLGTLQDSDGDPLYSSDQINDIASAYIVEEVTDASKLYYDTFEIIEDGALVKYGVLLKDKDYDGTTNTIAYNNLGSVITDYVVGTTNDGFTIETATSGTTGTGYFDIKYKDRGASVTITGGRYNVFGNSYTLVLTTNALDSNALDYELQSAVNSLENTINSVITPREYNMSSDEAAGISSLSGTMRIEGNGEIRANNVVLPDLSIDPYAEYKLGFTREFDGSMSSFIEAAATSGGRQGYSIQAGVKWDY